MANWDKLNEELDSALNSMSKEDWVNWKNSCILDWELHQKVMAKKNTIKICTGIGLNMFFPEYVTIEFNPKTKNNIITDWLEEHSDPEIDKKIEKHLEKITKTKKNG